MTAHAALKLTGDFSDAGTKLAFALRILKLLNAPHDINYPVQK